MGTGPFAVPSFEALRLAGHEIAMVVTRPARAVKSRKGPPPAPVRDWAESHGLEVFAPDSINEAEAVASVAGKQSQLLVVCDYGQILKPDALGTATLGGINLHGSLLPKYRGAAPVQCALLSGDQVTGVSIIHMTPRLDGGPVITRSELEIDEHETAGELEDRLALLGVAATLEAVEMLCHWDGESVIGGMQDASAITKAPRLKKSDAEIDWDRPARLVHCHVRGMQPWPIAYTHFKPVGSKPAIRMAIKEIRVLDEPAGSHAPGEIVPRDEFVVATSDSLIEIQKLQPAGKREMAGVEFLRGHNPPAGTILG
ncbi:MAG: methionyl-tRNA formyltransferase [Planctomycetaceae bacterium]|nr:methionyl-tRNA formyltransferase [Planctomycetaceae bacterium]